MQPKTTFGNVGCDLIWRIRQLTLKPGPVYRCTMGMAYLKYGLNRGMQYLAVLAIVLWALLPAGLMPVHSGAGGLTFALCSGKGPIMVAVGADGIPVPLPHMPGHEKQPCPYAAAALSVTGGSASLLPSPLPFVLTNAEPLPTALALIANVAFARPIPRGPPDLPNSV